MEFPDTPVGRQASWYVSPMTQDTLPELSWEEASTHFAPDYLKRMPPQTEAQWQEQRRRNREANGIFRILSISPTSDFEMDVRVESARGKKSKIYFAVEESPPHKITFARWTNEFDFNLVMREATELDASVLREIEIRSPVVARKTSIATDRGEDYFAAKRLMEEAKIILAEIDGEPAGLSWYAIHPGRVAGIDQRLGYFFHLRVLPEHQRKGLWGAFSGKGWQMYHDQMDNFVGSFAPGNVAWTHVGEKRGMQNPNVWQYPALRAVLDTSQLAGPSYGRAATSEDIDRIVELLNATHEKEELYFPYTTTSLTERFSRDPVLYSLARVWLTDEAVVGVWPAGEKILIETTREGVTVESRRGLVLDYGFMPGAEDELAMLLKAWCGWLAARGLNQLSMFTSEGSSSYDLLKSMTDIVEPFYLTFSIHTPLPADIHGRGLYVDHLYF